MNNYLIVGIIISIVCILVLNSDLLKLDFLNYEIRKKSKLKKIDLSESYVNYDTDSETNSSKNKKTKKNLDDTEISFDDSSDKSKMFNNKNTNKKLLNNIKKFMIDMKNKKETKRGSNEKNSRNSRDNRDSRDSRGREDNKRSNDIKEMHKLAQQLSKKNSMQNQQSDNTNYDLTDTISGIINHELNNL